MKMGMEYFSHDFNASENRKLLRVRMNLGWEGYGIYWALIERLYSSGGYISENDLDVFAFGLQIDVKKLDDIVRNYDLFTINNGQITSQGVLERLKLREEKTQALKERASKGGRAKANKEDVLCLDSACSTLEAEDKQSARTNKQCLSKAQAEDKQSVSTNKQSISTLEAEDKHAYGVLDSANKNKIKLNKNINKIKNKLNKIKSVCLQSDSNTRAREGQTTEDELIRKIDFYHENITSRLDECEGDERSMFASQNFGNQLREVVDEVSRLRVLKINERELTADKFLSALNNYFRKNGEKCFYEAMSAYETKIEQGEVKNKFNYLVSTLYNSALLVT